MKVIKRLLRNLRLILGRLAFAQELTEILRVVWGLCDGLHLVILTLETIVKKIVKFIRIYNLVL
jgi:hypothetical protein